MARPPPSSPLVALAIASALAWSGCTRSSVVEPPPEPPPQAESATAESPATAVAETKTTSEPEPAATPDAAAPAPAIAGKVPLTDEQKRVFLSTPEDEPTEVRLGVTRAREGKHYLAGNEKTLQAFYNEIKDLGGGYVGVGSDQAYILIGWAKPEFVWLVDYDADVVAIHAVYRAFFLSRETPEEFMALWAEDGRAAGKAILAEHYEGRELKRYRNLYLRYRGWINRRLTAVKGRFDEDEVPSFLNDQATYDHIKAMLKAGRIRPMVTNLLADKGVNGIAEAARALGVPIRLLYLSNAEEYWQRYSKQFRANIQGLEFDSRSLILRTLLTWSANGDYIYNVQPGENFKTWLAEPKIRNVYDIAHARPKPVPGEINFFRVDTDPNDSPRVRKAEERSAMRKLCRSKRKRERPKACDRHKRGRAFAKKKSRRQLAKATPKRGGHSGARKGKRKGKRGRV